MSFHPSYTFDDADLVLASKEGVKFQVHSIFLKHASGFFRSMFEMKRDINEGPEDPIQMDESQEILKAMLDVCYPDRSFLVSDITSFDFLRDLAFIFVEKYDIPAGVAVIRNFFFDSRIESKVSSILLYGLARRFNWEEEIASASRATLEMDFRSQEIKLELSTLEAKDILDLYALRELRKQSVLDILELNTLSGQESEDETSTWHDIVFPGCVCRGWGAYATTTVGWVAFCCYISKELERQPSGTGLESVEFWEDPIIRRIWVEWECKCLTSKGESKSKIKGVKSVITSTLNDLPKTTEELLLLKSGSK